MGVLGHICWHFRNRLHWRLEAVLQAFFRHFHRLFAAFLAVIFIGALWSF